MNTGILASFSSFTEATQGPEAVQFRATASTFCSTKLWICESCLAASLSAISTLTVKPWAAPLVSKLFFIAT